MLLSILLRIGGEKMQDLMKEYNENLILQTDNVLFLKTEKYKTNTWEVCLKSVNLEHYKYRIMFLHKITIQDFPICVDFDEVIAEELSLNNKVYVHSKKDFDELIINIFSSNKIDRVVKALL